MMQAFKKVGGSDRHRRSKTAFQAYRFYQPGHMNDPLDAMVLSPAPNGRIRCWANPQGSWRSHRAAAGVFELPGAARRMAIVSRQGGHDHTPARTQPVSGACVASALDGVK
jgi:hypothetical protein